MKYLFTVLCCFVLAAVNAQDVNILLKEADNFEKQQKDPEAIEKYKQVLAVDPVHIKALTRAAELNASIGTRQPDKNSKRLYYETALSLANRAFQADSSNAEASYAMAMASGKMTEVESENKKIVAYVRDVKTYGDKALSLNADFGKAHYIIGKWHYEMVNLSGIKKAALKLIYGGMPAAEMDSAIAHMEKCRTLEPYFVANYLDLAKAYRDDHKPAQALEVLNRLVKLPTRTANDVAMKAEGAKLLESLQ